MIGTFEEMWRDMEKGVFDCTVNGACSGCGACCSNFLPISKEEIRRIKQYVKKNHIKEQMCNYPTAEPLLNFTCPFRDNTRKKCLIYKVRPAICRDFQCDKPRKKIFADKEMYHKENNPVDMRAEFYGRQSVFATIHQELLYTIYNPSQEQGR